MNIYPFCLLFSAFFLFPCLQGQESWFVFDPPVDTFAKESFWDFRSLNESFAGEQGFISTSGDKFIHSTSGAPVRFWAVNVPVTVDRSLEEWRQVARLLAKYGVNLVRIHGAVYQGRDYTRHPDDMGKGRPQDLSDHKVEGIMRAVAAMKEQGIYTHLSLHFPLWLRPLEGDEELVGYDGDTNSFGISFFNPQFQNDYARWWESVLLTENPYTSIPLVEDPALMGIEILNEDSLLFRSFGYHSVPVEQMALLEKDFGRWARKQYGSVDEALSHWDFRISRDMPEENRLGFRPIKQMAEEKTPRDRDTIRFLVETQRNWYDEKRDWFRSLGFRGVITASNWMTAHDRVLDPLERYTYLGGDFIDHHLAYFLGAREGTSANWSIREGHQYFDRSQLRFDPKDPRKASQDYAVHMVKPTWNQKPTTISETAWERPNRYRSEGVPLYALYGSLHDIDSIMHFQFKSPGGKWQTRYDVWLQPWDQMTPVQLGQFPAFSYLYRKGLIKTPEPAAVIHLEMDNLFALKGQPMGTHGGLDMVRGGDSEGISDTAGDAFSPLRYWVGPIHIHLSEEAPPHELPSMQGLIDESQKKVKSSSGELELDYQAGTVIFDAPQAQGFVGSLSAHTGPLQTRHLKLETEAELMHVALISLDGQSLDRSQRMLLQVITEEQHSNWETKSVPDGAPGQKQIVKLGGDPFQVRKIQGLLEIQGDPVTVTALDYQGLPIKVLGNAINQFELFPETIYYGITRPESTAEQNPQPK